jgi:GAF domain-containing protein
MAFLNRFSTTHDDLNRRGRNAFWGSAVVFFAFAVAVGLSIAQAFGHDDWRLYALAGVNMAGCLAATLAMISGQRRPELAMLAVTLAGGLAVVAAGLLIAGIGIPLGFLVITAAVLLALLTTQQRGWTFLLIGLAAVPGLVAIGLQLAAPALQLSLPAARPAVLLVYAALFLPLAGILMRQFGHLGLRLKLILLCLIVALIPLALTLELNYMLAKAAVSDPPTAMMTFSQVVDNALLTGIVIIALAAGLAVLVNRSLVAPLKRLTAGVEKVKSGNFYTDIRVEANDEIGLLAAAVNQMTDQLRNIWVGLEQRTADRTRASNLTAAVSRKLSTVLDQAQLLNEVADLLREAFNFYHVQICLLDSSRDSLVFAGGTGDAGRIMLERGYQIPVGQGPLGRAADINAVVHVSDVARDASWLPNPLLPDTKAELAVPISLGDQALGVIDIHKNTPGAVRTEDIEVIQSIGSQMALALRNVQSYAQAQQQAGHIALFSSILQKIQAAPDPEAAMQLAAAELSQALKGPRVTLRLPAPGQAEVRAGSDTLAAPITFPIQAGGLTAAEFVVTGLKDLNESAGLIKAVAGQLGLQLEKRRLAQQAQSAGDEAGTLADASGQLNAADALDKVLLAVAGPAIRAEAGEALLFVTDAGEDGRPEWLEVRANWAREGSFALPVGVRLFAHGQPAIRLAGDAPDGPLTIADVARDERLDAALRQAYNQMNTQATVILPLVQSGRLIGLITANWTGPHAFTDTETRLYRSLARLGAVAVSNLLLQATTQAALAESEQLYNAGRRITSATSLQELVTDLAENVSVPAVNRAVLITLDQPAGPGSAADIRVVSNWHSGRGTAPAPVGAQFPAQSPAGQSIFLRSEPGFFDDAQLDSSIDPGMRTLFAEQRVRGLAVLPLWAGARQLGCLLVESDDPHHFTDAEIRPFTALAQQMAVVIENHHLGDQVRAAQSESAQLIRAGDRVKAAQDSDSLLQNILQPAIASGAELGGLFTFELDDRGCPAWAVSAADWRQGGPALFPAGARICLTDLAIARLWLDTPETALYIEDSVNDRRLDPESQAIFEQTQTRSAAWLPLSAGGRWIGIAYIYWREPHAFGPAERRLYAALSVPAALRLENLVAQAGARKQSERDSVVSRISNKIQSTTSVEDAVQTAVRELGLALKARRAVVELGAPAEHRNGH